MTVDTRNNDQRHLAAATALDMAITALCHARTQEGDLEWGNAIDDLVHDAEFVAKKLREYARESAEGRR